MIVMVAKQTIMLKKASFWMFVKQFFQGKLELQNVKSIYLALMKL